MSDLSTNLMLPYVAAGQAQKHVTVNESLRRLDALVQLAVVSASVGAQPATPGDGELYILPPGKTGADWGAMANLALAYYCDGVWEEISPREGWLAFVKDSGDLCCFTGSAWDAVVGGGGSDPSDTPTLAGLTLATPVGNGGVNIRGHSFGALSDNAADSIELGSGALGFIFLLNSGVEYALLLFDFVGTPGISVISGHASVTAANLGPLTGTTGADGALTLSVHTDNKLYIENRLGAARILSVFVLG